MDSNAKEEPPNFSLSKPFSNRNIVLPPLLFDQHNHNHSEQNSSCENIYRDMSPTRTMTPHRTTTIVDSSLILVTSNVTDHLEEEENSSQSSETDLESQHGKGGRKRLGCPAFGTECSYDPLLLQYVLISFMALIYNGLLIGAVLYSVEKSGQAIDWCNGVGFMLLFTAIAYLGLFYKFVVKRFMAKWLTEMVLDAQRSARPKCKTLAFIMSSRFTSWGMSLVILVSGLTFLILDAQGHQGRLVALLGICLVVVFGGLISADPKLIRWKILVIGMASNLSFGLAFTRWPFFRHVVVCLNTKLQTFMGFSNFGLAALTTSTASTASNNNVTARLVDAFETTEAATILWPSGSILIEVVLRLFYLNLVFTLLNFYGVIDWLLNNFGWLCKTMVGLSEIEAVACLLFSLFGGLGGPALAFFALNPYLFTMTKSESNTLLTLSMVSASYSAATVNPFEVAEAADFSLASLPVMYIMSGLIMAKLLRPEKKKMEDGEEEPEAGGRGKKSPLAASNSLEAVLNSMGEMPRVVGFVFGSVMAFSAIVLALDRLIQWIGSLYGLRQFGLIFIGRHILRPILWVLGVTWEQTETMAFIKITAALILFTVVVASVENNAAASEVVAAETGSSASARIETGSGPLNRFIIRDGSYWERRPRRRLRRGRRQRLRDRRNTIVTSSRPYSRRGSYYYSYTTRQPPMSLYSSFSRSQPRQYSDGIPATSTASNYAYAHEPRQTRRRSDMEIETAEPQPTDWITTTSTASIPNSQEDFDSDEMDFGNVDYSRRRTLVQQLLAQNGNLEPEPEVNAIEPEVRPQFGGEEYDQQPLRTTAASYFYSQPPRSSSNDYPQRYFETHYTNEDGRPRFYRDPEPEWVATTSSTTTTASSTTTTTSTTSPSLTSATSMISDEAAGRYKEGQLRLVGGRNENEGNVEILHMGEWGSICDDEWDHSEANIACKMLGFPGAKRHTHSAQFGYGLHRFWMDNLYCYGTEKTLQDCRFDGWGIHDCERTEAAGVQCKDRPPPSTTPPPTTTPRPLRGLADQHGENIALRITGGRDKNEGRVEVKLSDSGPWGPVCGDGWGVREAMVVCRELGLFYAQAAVQTHVFNRKLNSSIISGPVERPLISGLSCKGNEETLAECEHDPTNFCPGSGGHEVAGVVCVEEQADLKPDLYALMSSVYLEDKHLFFLQCAMEENCLGQEAYRLRNENPNFSLETRRLLRFTASIANVGNADFSPFIPKASWQWHACHQHYHSMEVFAHFDILDHLGNRVSEGHKASFCLEDNDCDSGVEPKYDCENYGDQGISPGCKDIYYANIDCQWLDVTDLDLGTYTFKLSINPEYKVAEQTFENNAAICTLIYTQQYASVHNCSYTRP